MYVCVPSVSVLFETPRRTCASGGDRSDQGSVSGVEFEEADVAPRQLVSRGWRSLLFRWRMR